MSKEAMKHEINLVLTDPDSVLSHGARRALRYVLQSLEALAEQPAQQEPYGYVWFNKNMEHRFTSIKPHPDMGAMDITPIYTSPPAQQNIRNATLDEIATKIAAMPFGDTAASFAVWIREQKK